MNRLSRAILFTALFLAISGPCLAASATKSAAGTANPPKRMANTTWGSYLNPGKDAPIGSFRVMYINTNSPRQVIATEVVQDIAVNYAYQELHDIPSEDFGAYWVGQMYFSAPETRMINISQSWSKARIIIDGEIAYEGGGDVRQSFAFSKGMHLVEVEYINNWHTTEFRVLFDRQREAFTKAQIRAALGQRKIVNPDVHYVGVYESKSKDLSISLYPARNLKNVVLVLSSYAPVKWTVNDPARSNIGAIIYSSLKPGSDVVGAGVEKILLLPYRGSVGSYQFEPRCFCSGTSYHCENASSLLSTKTAVEDLTGSRLVGFSGAYSASDFVLPDRLVDAEMLRTVKATVETQDRMREQCSRKADPDFEHMPQ